MFIDMGILDSTPNTPGNNPYNSDYIKDITLNEGKKDVRIDGEIIPLKSFLFADKTDYDFSGLNEDFESIYRMYLTSNSQVPNLESFKEWVSEDNLKNATFSYDKKALVAYIKESTDNFLNQQEEEKQVSEQVKQDVEELYSTDYFKSFVVLRNDSSYRDPTSARAKQTKFVEKYGSKQDEINTTIKSQYTTLLDALQEGKYFDSD